MTALKYFLLSAFMLILEFQGIYGDECPPVPSEAVKVTRKGQKAWDKCIDLSELVYPCRRSPVIEVNPPLVRTRACLHSATPLVVGGTDALSGEFPHLALLGYGEQSSVQWMCGGSLISDRWVLTAGHCSRTRVGGDVRFVKVGGFNVDSSLEPRFLYNVTDVLPHPNYTHLFTYNDIALLKLDRAVELDEHIRPACLHTGGPIKDSRFILAGWGTTVNRGVLSNKLQKVVLEKFTNEECKARYPGNRKLRNGINEQTQFCAGHHTEAKDSCQGDGGSPLMIYNDAVDCTYLIVGITSHGSVCGIPGIPAVYTRVSGFIPWIESVVWP